MVALQISLARAQTVQLFKAKTNHSSGLVHRRPHAVNIRATATKNEIDNCDSNINEFCSLDEMGQKPVSQMTLGEKEQAFLEALSSFYYEGKPQITDAEFDLLKDELLWSGSKVAILSSNEKKFLEAIRAYNAGKPVMSNEEFDKLKVELKKENSVVTAEGPRCSIRSRKMYSDAQVDYLRLVALNIPAAVTVLFGLFSIDDLTGFEVTKLLELPEPFGIIVVWGVVLPVVYILSNAITSYVFKDALVLKASCPNCGTENFSYFGDILTVSGNRGENTVDCPNCKSKLVFNAAKRSAVVDTPSEQAVTA